MKALIYILNNMSSSGSSYAKSQSVVIPNAFANASCDLPIFSYSNRFSQIISLEYSFSSFLILMYQIIGCITSSYAKIS